MYFQSLFFYSGAQNKRDDCCLNQKGVAEGKKLSRPSALGFKLALIGPLKWGTLCVLTSTGSKMVSRQSWKREKNPSK